MMVTAGGESAGRVKGGVGKQSKPAESLCDLLSNNKSHNTFERSYFKYKIKRFHFSCKSFSSIKYFGIVFSMGSYCHVAAVSW